MWFEVDFVIVSMSFRGQIVCHFEVRFRVISRSHFDVISRSDFDVISMLLLPLARHAFVHLELYFWKSQCSLLKLSDVTSCVKVDAKRG